MCVCVWWGGGGGAGGGRVGVGKVVRIITFTTSRSKIVALHSPLHKTKPHFLTALKHSFQNVAMTSHVGKKSGLIPASSVTATTPAPGKATALSPSPYHGSYGGQTHNQDPPPPFLFVDSLKPIEIVISFTAFSRWLDPPLPIIRERDKEKEKDSNSVITGVN